MQRSAPLRAQSFQSESIGAVIFWWIMIFSEKPVSTVPDPAIKIESRGEDPAVVVGRRQRRCMIMRRYRHLIADARRELYVFRKLEAADHKARCEKHLVQSAALPIRPVRPVHLELGPEDLHQMILKSDVRLNLVAQYRYVRIRQDSRNRGLNIEIAPTLAERQRRNVRRGVI